MIFRPTILGFCLACERAVPIITVAAPIPQGSLGTDQCMLIWFTSCHGFTGTREQTERMRAEYRAVLGPPQ